MNSVMADDELDELYWVTPEKFTATRSRLAAAARERGDADSAKWFRCPQTHTAGLGCRPALVMRRALNL
jgi:hypothetical protein